VKLGVGVGLGDSQRVEPIERCQDAGREQHGSSCDVEMISTQTAGPAAPAPTPLHCVAGNRVERGFRGEFRPRVLDAPRYSKRLVPRDRCRYESAITRRGSVSRRAATDFRRAAPAPSAPGSLRGTLSSVVISCTRARLGIAAALSVRMIEGRVHSYLFFAMDRRKLTTFQISSSFS
jgi:hypothetical protein